MRGKQGSNRRWQIQVTSFAACVIPMYLASVLNNMTTDCFLDNQEIVPPFSVKTYLQIKWWSSVSLAQLASVKPSIPLDGPNFNSRSQVPLGSGCYIWLTPNKCNQGLADIGRGQ